LNEDRKVTREHTFKVENLADRIILLAVLGILGGPGVVSMVVPSARPLAFTSDDGAKLKEFDQILAERITILELTQDKIKEDDAECKDRVDTLTDVINQHRHDAPPRWVIEKLNHIEQELHRLEN